jgi:hypothetical protein
MQTAIATNGMIFDTQYENGFISVGKKSEGGAPPDELPIPDASALALKTLEARLEEDEEVEYSEGERILLGGRKVRFYRESKSKIFTFLGKGNYAREWNLVDESSQQYSSLSSKGVEETAYVVSVEDDSKEIFPLENLVENPTRKMLIKGKIYPTFDYEGKIYTIQGRGGAACAWTQGEGTRVYRFNSKSEKIEAELVHQSEVVKQEKRKAAAIPRKSDWVPVYSWLKI